MGDRRGVMLEGEKVTLGRDAVEWSLREKKKSINDHLSNSVVTESLSIFNAVPPTSAKMSTQPLVRSF